jgi:hypothetical protein
MSTVPGSSVSSMLLAVLALAACNGPSTPVPVSGDIAQLRGEWRGDYSSAQSGRSGTIIFHLDATSDTAHGDVLLVPSDPVGTQPNPGTQPNVNQTRPQPLTISFVRAAGGGITGRLDPYRDPECGCLLTTTFTGRVNGDVVEGTFVSFHQEMGRKTEGRWRAQRVKPGP